MNNWRFFQRQEVDGTRGFQIKLYKTAVETSWTLDWQLDGSPNRTSYRNAEDSVSAALGYFEAEIALRLAEGYTELSLEDDPRIQVYWDSVPFESPYGKPKAVAYLGGSRLVGFCGDDAGGWVLWDVDGRQLHTLQYAHDNQIQLLTSGSEVPAVFLLPKWAPGRWDKTGKEVASVRLDAGGDRLEMTKFELEAVFEDDELIIGAYADEKHIFLAISKECLIHEVASGRCVARTSIPYEACEVQFLPQRGTMLVFQRTEPKAVAEMNPWTGEVVRTMGDVYVCGYNQRACAISLDERVAIMSLRLRPGSEHALVDLETLEAISSHDELSFKGEDMIERSTQVAGMSPDGKIVYLKNNPLALLAVDAKSGAVLWRNRPFLNSSLAIASDGKTIAFVGSDSMVQVWDACTGEPKVAPGGAVHATRLAWYPQWERVAMETDGQVQLVTLSGEVVGKWAGADLMTHPLIDEMSFYVGGELHRVRVSDGEPLSQAPSFRPRYARGCMGPSVNVYSYSEENVLVMKRDGSWRKQLSKGTSATVDFALSPDESLLYMSGTHQQQSLNDRREYHWLRVMVVGTGNYLEIETAQRLSQVQVSPDGKWLAAVTTGNEVVLYSTADGMPKVHEVQLQEPKLLGFTGDGQLVVQSCAQLALAITLEGLRVRCLGSLLPEVWEAAVGRDGSIAQLRSDGRLQVLRARE